MAVYSGIKGITALRAKVKQKSKMLVGESATKLATVVTDASPVGAPYYASNKGAISNDQGDFKNSWVVGLGVSESITRPADSTGAASIADAIVKGKSYNLQEFVYLTNDIDHAVMVENGWQDNPEYGWKAKGGYSVVGSNIGVAKTILNLVAEKVSKI